MLIVENGISYINSIQTGFTLLSQSQWALFKYLWIFFFSSSGKVREFTENLEQDCYEA